MQCTYQCILTATNFSPHMTIEATVPH